MTTDLRVFGRFGWNEGQHESFAYTEVDQTMEFGGDYSGRRLVAAYDKVGVTFRLECDQEGPPEVSEVGGLGFLLGDGI